MQRIISRFEAANDSVNSFLLAQSAQCHEPDLPPRLHQYRFGIEGGKYGNTKWLLSDVRVGLAARPRPVRLVTDL
jgi:hypothetical protein